MSLITKERRAHLIREWAERITAIDAAHAELCRLTLAALDSPLIDAGLRVAEAYTHATSGLVGDENDWLIWFWLENNMGANGLSAGFDPEIVPINSIEQIIKIIEREQP